MINSFPENIQDEEENSISLAVSGRHEPLDNLPSTLM